MKQTYKIIIPARYGSTRLKAKALADINGKPMIQHVYERTLLSSADSVVIATDDERIKKVAEGFGAKVCMTSAEHPSGTSRLAEAAKVLNYRPNDIVIGVQGDEPLIPPEIIDQVAEDLIKYKTAKMATLCEPIKNYEDLLNPNAAKVIMDKDGMAIYFSRAPIPYERDNFNKNKITFLEMPHYRHIGIYAYRAGFLQEYVKWVPTQLEKAEMLEQLRILYYGEKIHVSLAKVPVSLGVDTEEDLIKVRGQVLNRGCLCEDHAR